MPLNITGNVTISENREEKNVKKSKLKLKWVIYLGRASRKPYFVLDVIVIVF